MDAGVVYAWGFVGGVAAAVFVYVVPVLAQLATSDEPPMSRRRATAMLVLTVLLSAVAGLIPLIPDAVSRGQAISLGLASQAVVKGLISGARDALRPVAVT